MTPGTQTADVPTTAPPGSSRSTASCMRCAGPRPRFVTEPAMTGACASDGGSHSRRKYRSSVTWAQMGPARLCPGDSAAPVTATASVSVTPSRALRTRRPSSITSIGIDVDLGMWIHPFRHRLAVGATPLDLLGHPIPVALAKVRDPGADVALERQASVGADLVHGKIRELAATRACGRPVDVVPDLVAQPALGCRGAAGEHDGHDTHQRAPRHRRLPPCDSKRS